MSNLKVNARGEVLRIRSPAEFFAENQNIAGFDNPGKSLFTTIRELVENALDACESIQILPEIEVSITEMNEMEFNKMRGIHKIARTDHQLYASEQPNKKKRKKIAMVEVAKADEVIAAVVESAKGGKKKEILFYKIVVRDNGTGMKHDDIPDMLGRVLSGSKYGVRQTRGKFGLGAKMALIWSKKSTGMPIDVKTAHAKNGSSIPHHISRCTLDIDIYKNEPNLLLHEKRSNGDGWRGTEMTVVIGGNWTTYKSRIVQYMQQLAIITPYAALELAYECTFNEKKSFTVRYERRSDKMPVLAQEVKHHPSALNDLLFQQLVDHSPNASLEKFLCTQLSNIDKALATRMITELGNPFDNKMTATSLTTKQVHTVVRLLKQVEFKAPDGKFLSPAGEYNLRLGVIKELDPVMVATHTEMPAVFEGHSFIVEAAVSIGGKDVKEGINIFRFANRIPLLFEAGGDVVTRTAMKSIKWSQYKIDHKRDKVGVFVSIVSTKIPFKGTGKEYIGDDIPEMKKAVKHVLQQCCAQLRSKLLKRNKNKENALRKKNLSRYVPDAARAVHGVLEQMKSRLEEASSSSRPRTTTSALLTRTRETMLRALQDGTLSEAFLNEKLMESVDVADEVAALEQVTAAGRDATARVKTFLVPWSSKRALSEPLYHPTASMQFFTNVYANP